MDSLTGQVLVSLSIAVAAACSYELGLVGKSCDYEHPCPPPLVCITTVGNVRGTCQQASACQGDKCGLTPCNNAPGQLFPAGAPWNTPVADASLDAESTDIISYLATNHLSTSRFLIDFDHVVLTANASTPHRSFAANNSFYTPDCDGAAPPIPEGGAVEGEVGYECTSGDTCRLLVVDRDACQLFELFSASIAPDGTFTSGCQAIWDVATVPPPWGRGEHCTSADAAGLPIAPLLFGADEVETGTIAHALRFALPSELICRRVYVHPATHSSGALSGGSNAPVYGARLRLKANVAIDGLKPAAQVVARALREYGMYLAESGARTFFAQADRFTAATWSSLQLEAGDLQSLAWTDFEVVDGGTRINWDGSLCDRTPIN